MVVPRANTVGAELPKPTLVPARPPARGVPDANGIIEPAPVEPVIPVIGGKW